MKVTIDASEFNTVGEFHELLKEKLDFPETYADTLDDLWDCLMNHCTLPLSLYWIDFETSHTLIGDPINEIVELLNEAHDEIDDFIIEFN
jgi:ribonuclease inhibitor